MNKDINKHMELIKMWVMAIQVMKFSNGGAKLERFLPKNQHTQRKLLNFENWTNGGLRVLKIILPFT
jgi:hypothetical protein